jgi:hypothetical protein
MGKSCRLFFAFLALVLIVGSCACGMRCAFAQASQAESRLEAPSSAVDQAFKAVLAAERAGANVTGMLVRLNYAAGLLAQEEIDARNGDPATVANRADSVLSIASEVKSEAVSAKEAAVVAGRNDLWTTFAFSSIGVVVFVLVLFFVWLRLKSNYVKNLVHMKPEVISSEA